MQRQLLPPERISSAFFHRMIRALADADPVGHLSASSM
jgi:hypothetical protein